MNYATKRFMRYQMANKVKYLEWIIIIKSRCFHEFPWLSFFLFPSVLIVHRSRYVANIFTMQHKLKEMITFIIHLRLKDIDTRLMKAWIAIDWLSIIWKSDLTDKMKRSFFQAAVVSMLLYGCTTWTLTKRLKKKLDGNYTRMLRAILNKSWRQHPTRHQLYGHLPPIMKTIQARRTRHAWHCWRSRDVLISKK